MDGGVAGATRDSNQGEEVESHDALRSKEISSGPSQPPSHTRGRIPTHRKQQLELEALQGELARLKVHVMETQVNASQKMSYWERVAKMEQLDTLKAGLENEDLHAAVEKHKILIDELDVHLRKKRRLVAAPGDLDTWDTTSSLPPADDRPRRVRAMHTAVDREFHRMHSIFLQQGLLSTTDDVFCGKLTAQPAGDMYFDVVQYATLGAPFRVIGDAMRSVVLNVVSDLPDGVDHAIEAVDDCTVYSHMTDRRGERPCHAHLVTKYYPSETRDVVIWRSILTDPAWPTHADDLVDDVTSWVEAVALPGQDTCLFTMVVRRNLGQLTAKGDDDVAELLQAVSLSQRPHLVGFLSPHAVSHHSLSRTGLSLGNLPLLLERSMLVEEPFKRAINDAIERHKQTLNGHLRHTE
ncbi:Aste57867_3412 [Aphanomyces stellatus]|uniref:Aste57867_3412 protein n=1 Tax=Aphanomyces stellatus TaxID=120398 RepID=A0A485KF38_9STRA|nr:hypothetical protein As57867_003402 [Aphanomyces stellatus]VFT80578.1 Aste57867_3412 [Aphanomyces stellatus]